MKRVTYHLTEEQLQKLEARRTSIGVPVAEQIRRAVDEYLREEEGKVQEELVEPKAPG